ncbi:MAG: CBS domain-containing protein [Candidatus Pacearchaeota archaeon]
MIVDDLMQKPIVIERDMSLSDAAKLLTKNSISSLIVVLGGKVSGIISSKDLVAHFGEQKKVSEVMNTKVITLKKGDKMQKALDIVKDNELSIMPVVDKKGEIIGTLYVKDILNQACESEDFLID